MSWLLNQDRRKALNLLQQMIDLCKGFLKERLDQLEGLKSKGDQDQIEHVGSGHEDHMLKEEPETDLKQTIRDKEESIEINLE